MPSSFRSVAELLENVESTKKRLEIIDLAANFLKNLSQEEIEPAINMMVGRAFPKYSQKNLDVSWTTLTRVLERVSSFDWGLFRQAMAGTGDIGSATKKVLEQSKVKRQTQLSERPLSILEVGGHWKLSPKPMEQAQEPKRAPDSSTFKPSHTS